MPRDNLMPPATQTDIYLHDIALHLRALVDLMTPAPQPPAADTVELREPAPAMTTRDKLQAAATSAPTGPPDAPTGATAAPVAQPATVASRRHPKA